MLPKNLQPIFDLPDDMNLVHVIYDILKKNNIKDDFKQWSDRANRGEESQVVIMQHAAIVLFKKMAPEEKIIELLQKHLTINQQIAKKVLSDIKLSLIPYMKNPEQEIIGGVKPVEIKDVAENAKVNEVEKKFTDDQKNIILETQTNKKAEPANTANSAPKTKDTYREPIE